MSLLKAQIFNAGIFKQAKYLASTPQRAEKHIYCSETGVLSLELLPMGTGHMTAEKEHMTWAVVHALKMKLTKFGNPVQDTGVMLISERSYVPLDPMGKIKEKQREKIASLVEIAKSRHSIACANVGAENTGATPLAHVVTWGSLVIIIISLIGSMISCGGG